MGPGEQQLTSTAPEAVTPVGVSLATIGVVTAVLLIYGSGAFLLTAIFGVKREAQVALLIPVALSAAYFVVLYPGRLFNPLILYSVARLVTELALRGQLSFVLDAIATALAMVVITCAPRRSFEAGTRLLITLAGILASMALLQWFLVLLDPSLAQLALDVVTDESSGEVTISDITHPFAALGLISDPINALGFTVVRMQSFAMEPSLNVLYFLMPAALAFLLNRRDTRFWGYIILAFGILSLSGSVLLTLGFSAFWWALVRLRLLSISFVVPYGILMLLALFLVVLFVIGIEPLLNLFTYLSQYGDFLSKGTSLTARTSGTVANAAAAAVSPFGVATTATVPGPMLITAAVSAGWLGVMVLLVFFARLGRRLDAYDGACRHWSAPRLGSTLLVGAIATVLVFNDYQMGVYAGLVQLGVLYRAIKLKSGDRGSARGGERTASTTLPGLTGGV